MRKLMTAVVAAATALVLTACAGIPTAGGVNEGRVLGGDVEPPDFSLVPDPPRPGASPAEIVDGFLRAGSGPQDDWARAREFLSPSFRVEWQPQAGVTIDVLGTRTTRELDEDTVSVLASQVARVDEKGSYERVDEGTTALTFELAQQSDGEWRIIEAPDGIVLDRALFPSVFAPYPLAYFDPTWDHLVPDVRWFARSRVVTRITEALVNRPKSEWLAASVVSAFEGVEVVSTPVNAGVATVQLNDAALALDQQTWDRMQTQLEESLVGAGVSEVEMLVGTTTLAAEPVPVRRTTIAGQALVSTDEGFGFLSAAGLTPIPGLSAKIGSLDASAVQVGPDRDVAAVQLADGTVWRVPAASDDTLVDDRPGLISPTIDPLGVIWTVPREEPQALRAHLPDGSVVSVGDAWPEATHISAIAVSRDGARIAAVVTAGGRTIVLVSGVVRASGGTGWLLGAPLELGTAAGAGRGLAWLDDTTLGVLSGETGSISVLEQLVGGPGSASAGPGDAVSLAGGATLATTRVRASDGTLYVRRGQNWQEIAGGVLVLATQQGMPE
jgi:hypothetical protein